MYKNLFLLPFVVITCAISVPSFSRDINNPKEYVDFFRKVRCSIKDGEVTIGTWEGNMYSRVEGEKDRKLFKVLGMNINKCVSVTNEKKQVGYRSISRELMLYLDPDNSTVLKTWKNPWTGEEVEVVHVANDPVNQKYADFGYDRSGKPSTVALKDLGDVYGFNYEVPLFYNNPLAGEYQDYVGNHYHAMELFNFFVTKKDADSKQDKVKYHIAWTRIAQWLPWMKMGSRPGLMVVNTQGKKVFKFEELDPILVNAINTTYPLYKTAPPDNDARENETSWTVFKKYIDGKKTK
ncbi:MAG: DUF1838 family protein [Methylacidiphilales bacterium]|nr:DUF1838 family protein [Candidatus Methylacidiphilales bacterium]